MPLVGFILILMALFAVGATLYMVTREHVEHEEWYVPPTPGSTPATPPPTPTVTAQPGTTSVPTPVPPAPEAAAPEAKKPE